MTYVKTDGAGTALQYPYTARDFRADNPDVSFAGERPTDEQLADFNVFPVTIGDRPAGEPGRVTERNALPTFDGAEWVLGWTIRDRTAGELSTERQTLVASKFGLVSELAERGAITADEAFAWAGGNALPAALETYITGASAGNRVKLLTRLEAVGPGPYARTGRVAAAVQATWSLTPVQMDRLWRASE